MAAAEKLKSFSKKKKLVYARALSSIDSSSCGRVFESRKVKIRNLGKAPLHYYSEYTSEGGKHCVYVCMLYIVLAGPARKIK